MPRRNPRSHDYTEAERATLAVFYPAHPRPEVLAALPGRSWHSIGVAASEMSIRRNATWPAAGLALLLADYPLRGGAYVARQLGKHPESVAKKAYALGLARQHFTPEQRLQRKADYRARARAAVLAARLDSPAVPPRAARPAPAPKPVADKTAPLLAVKRSAGTPVLNVAKEARKRKEAGQRIGLAEAIARHKTLRYGQPEHTAFLRDGLLGWQRWQAQQAA